MCMALKIRLHILRQADLFVWILELFVKTFYAIKKNYFEQTLCMKCVKSKQQLSQMFHN